MAIKVGALSSTPETGVHFLALRVGANRQMPSRRESEPETSLWQSRPGGAASW